MLLSRAVSVGIDPRGGRRGLAYAALDEDLRLVALGRGSPDEVLAYVGGQGEAFAALNGPPRPNRGLMAQEGLRAKLPESPRAGRWENCRLAEYELRRRGIRIYLTPSKEEDCKAWVRLGFDLYRRLEALGFRPYPAGEGAEKQVMEASPLVCYTLWLGRQPYRRRTLEGRWQRQLALYERGLEIPDPMRYLEEITRHRLLQGALPDGILHPAAELEALALAYAAWLARRGRQVTLVGDPREGQVLAPVGQLRERY